MDENKVIRPMDFVRLTNIDELNVIKDTKNHIGLVKEVSRDGRMSIIWIGETYSQLAWFKSSELEVVDNLVSILTCGLANFRGDGSFDEAGGLDLVRHGYEWIRRMRKFENKADRHTFQKVFGNKRGNELWDCFLEVGRSIFILEDSYFLINDRNVFSLCLAECSDYDLYELVHNIDTDSDQGK